MDRLALNKTLFVREGNLLLFNIKCFSDPLSIIGEKTVFLYENKIEEDPKIIAESYNQWINKLAELDKKEELGNFDLIDEDTLFDKQAIQKIITKIEKILEKLNSINGTFFLKSRNTKIEVLNQDKKEVLFFYHGKKRVGLLLQLKTGNKVTKTLIGKLWPEKMVENSKLSKLVSEINERFKKETSSNFTLIDSGKKNQGYQLNEKVEFSD